MKNLKQIGISLLAFTVMTSITFAAKESKADATLRLSFSSVAVGVGFSSGSGTLTYKGKTYPVKVKGMSVGRVGVTSSSAHGEVFNLKHLQDFNGHYDINGAGTRGVTLGAGKTGTLMSNQAGVIVRVSSTQQGVSVNATGGGVDMRPEISSRLFQPKHPHSRADRIIKSESSTLVTSTRILQVAATCGRLAMRSRTEASNGFGVSDPPLLLTTMSVPRAFNPTCQPFSNPRDMPTNATTAAMPMEIPVRVNPVRKGRPLRPRTTTVKKVIVYRPRRFDRRSCEGSFLRARQWSHRE